MYGMENLIFKWKEDATPVERRSHFVIKIDVEYSCNERDNDDNDCLFLVP